MDCRATRLVCPCDFPGKNTGMGCNFLLQGIFPTQGLNPCLLHWQEDSLPLSHLGSPNSGVGFSIYLHLSAPLDLQSFVISWFSHSRPIPHSWVPMILIVPNNWPNKTHDRHPHLLPLYASRTFSLGTPSFQWGSFKPPSCTEMAWNPSRSLSHALPAW